MGFTEKKSTDDDELEEKIYEPTEEMVREAEEEEARQRASKGIFGVVHPLLHLQMKEPRKKHTTFPWKLAPHDGPRLLGPLTQLNGLSFLRGRKLMWWH